MQSCNHLYLSKSSNFAFFASFSSNARSITSGLNCLFSPNFGVPSEFSVADGPSLPFFSFAVLLLMSADGVSSKTAKRSSPNPSAIFTCQVGSKKYFIYATFDTMLQKKVSYLTFCVEISETAAWSLTINVFENLLKHSNLCYGLPTSFKTFPNTRKQCSASLPCTEYRKCGNRYPLNN